MFQDTYYRQPVREDPIYREPIYEDPLTQKINMIWYNFDTDRSGALNKNETLRFLNHILAQEGKPKATIYYFNKFFKEIDINNDGVVSKAEMARFLRMYLNADIDPFYTLVQDIFMKYDKNGSGYLDKSETLKLLDEIMIQQGKPRVTMR